MLDGFLDYLVQVFDPLKLLIGLNVNRGSLFLRPVFRMKSNFNAGISFARFESLDGNPLT